MLPHKWRMSVLIPVTEKELADMGAGRARSFKLRIPPPPGDRMVTGFGVICERCKLDAAEMTPQERKRCRGEETEAEGDGG